MAEQVRVRGHGRTGETGISRRFVAIYRGLPKDTRAWLRLPRELPESVEEAIVNDIASDPKLDGYVPACRDKGFIETVMETASLATGI
jgi:hypothetical protein